MAINADNFILAKQIYIKEFNKIVSFINLSYLAMLSGKGKLQNNESFIRNKLHKDYLNNNTFRKLHKFKGFYFTCESNVINNSYNTIGFTDLKVLNQSSFEDTDSTFIFECKRLDGSNSLNELYITQGIKRFVKNKYPTFNSMNGVIGFLVKKSIEKKCVKKINNLLITKFIEANTIKRLTLDTKFPSYYHSDHYKTPKESKKDIRLFHLFLDFSNSI